MSAWEAFPGFAAAALLGFAVSLGLWAVRRPAWARLALAGGALAVLAFLTLAWIGFGRPPLRTYGETRLWYAASLGLAGTLLSRRSPWLLAWSSVLASGFVLATWLLPESHDRTLMPALRSPWFVPHVTVYLLGYAVCTAASLSGLRQILSRTSRPGPREVSLPLATGLLSVGLLLGALWAKEAWGHYWTWDPKETWAFLTWTVYLCALHLRARDPASRLVPWVLALGWIVLLLAWFGVQYLPAANASLHTYAR